jgi:hypothetical protein
MQLNLRSESTSDGVVDRSFTIGDIPGVLWSPERPTPTAPLVLMGHPGGLHAACAVAAVTALVGAIIALLALPAHPEQTGKDVGRRPSTAQNAGLGTV